MEWGYFDKFREVSKKYLPLMGEGDTKATQAVTAATQIIYHWYNDGDVYDNRYALLGWCNDFSSMANWLSKYTGTYHILREIRNVNTKEEYEAILVKLADAVLDMDHLKAIEEEPKQGSIYDCKGPFRFKYDLYYDEEDDDEDDWDEDDWDDEDEEW